jgi:choline/glycine/proline betaine transport protein
MRAAPAAPHANRMATHAPTRPRSRAWAPRAPGETNFRRWGFDVHPQVFVGSGVVITLFIVLTLLFGTRAETMFDGVQSAVAESAGWFYILAANVYLLGVVAIAASKYGRIRLGGPRARPEFSTFAWYAMLLSAGMGIGLMFWSVAEPVTHFETPPGVFRDIAPQTPAAAREAMGLTFFHWGLHAWGIYALVGLSLAFFAFNRGLPLTMRSVFFPLLGERIYGWAGNVIDVVAVVATLFGLATSLGLGAGQVNSGLGTLLAIPEATWVQVLLIALITAIATISVMAGLDGGVRRLSEFNIWVAAAFLFFVVAVGPTLFVLGSFVENIGHYLRILPALSFWTESFHDSPGGEKWQNGWTIFYWGWWISWSPFVGTFIARVSKGRTVREFVIGVILIPSLLSFVWMSTFGGTALALELDGNGAISSATSENTAFALFAMLKQLPWASITSTIAVLLVVTFFVTSSDSGSLVVDNLTSGGKLDSPVQQRVFWAVVEGAIAAVLLLGGGLAALQSAAIATGLPLAIVLLVAVFSLHRGLRDEHAELSRPTPPAREG